MTQMSKPKPSHALVVLSDNLKALKEKNEWTQDQLGTATGLGQKQAGRILNREIEPKLDTLSKIAGKLHVTEPVLLCPDMRPESISIKPGIKAALSAFIDDLIRIDGEGRLTDQTLNTLRSMLALAAPTAAAQSTRVKKAAQ